MTEALGINPLFAEAIQERNAAREREIEQEEIKGKVMPDIIRSLNKIYEIPIKYYIPRQYEIPVDNQDEPIEITLSREGVMDYFSRISIGVKDLPYEFLIVDSEASDGPSGLMRSKEGDTSGKYPKWQRPMTLQEAKSCSQLLETLASLAPVNQKDIR